MRETNKKEGVMTMEYIKPQVTVVAPVISAVQSSCLKFVPIVCDFLWIVFATTSAYESDE